MPIVQTVFLGVDVQGNTGNPAGAFGLVLDRVSCLFFDPSLSLWRESGAPFGSAQTTHSVASGALPPGVAIKHSPAGSTAGGACAFTPNQFGIAGVPTALGVYTGSFAASGNFLGDTFSITVALSGGCPLITITSPDGLDALLTGGTYALTFLAEDGVAPYSWDVAAGDLPDGLALSSGGLLSGTTTTPGASTVTIRATDDNGCPGVLELTITVVDPDPIELAPATLPDGIRGVGYLAIITATGGGGAPYVFTVTDGELPPGLTLSPAGILAGLPSRAGMFTFTVRATDPLALFGELEYTLTLAGLRFIIDGEDVTAEIAAADLELTLNRQATGHLEIGDGYIPARGAPVLIYARDGVTPIFGGLVHVRHCKSLIGGGAQSNPATGTGVDLVDYSIFFDDAEVTLTYTTDQDLEDVIAAIVAQSLAAYGITYTPTATGITVPPLDWQAISVTEAFKRITDATGVIFRVLPLLELVVFRPLDDPAPVSITDATINAFDLSWQDPPALAKNTVDLLCGPTGTGVATQQWTSDGIVDEWEVDIQAVIGTAEPAHAAVGYLTGSANFTAGETITLGSSTYTFRASLVGDVSGEVLIGGTIEISLEHLAAAIVNAGGGNYAPSTPINASAFAFAVGPYLEARALTPGTAGNSIAVADTAANAFWYGQGSIPIDFLEIGTDATGAAGWTQGFVLELPGAITRAVGVAGDPNAYYEWDVTDGRGTLTLGPVGFVPPAGVILEFKYLAVYPFHAKVSSGSPPRTFRENHPEIVIYADGIALATQILARESADRRELEIFTDVDGFLPGQELDVDTTYRGGIDDAFLVATVRIVLVNAELWEYTITAQETEEYAGSYVEQWKALTSGGSSSSTATPGTLVDGGASVAGDIYSDGRQSFRASQSMGGNKLTFLDDPAAAQDAATKAYVDAGDAGTIKADGSVDFTAAQSMGGNALEDVDDPTNAQDAATKAYVDAATIETGSLVLLESHSASSSSSLDFTTRNAAGQSGATFQGDYDEYMIEIVGLKPGTTATDLYMRISTDGGSTFLTAANYYWAHFTDLSSGASGAANGAGVGQIQITDATRLVTTAGTTTNASLRLANMINATNFMTVWGTQMGWISGTAISIVMLSGGYAVANTANALRFLASSGNIASGTIRIYGIKP